MKKSASMLGLVLVLGATYYVLKEQFERSPVGPAPPQQVLDVAGVKNDLLAIAQAERLYLASHGTYATLEQLWQEGALSFSGTNRRGYTYAAQVNGAQSFRIVAVPSDPEKQGWPALVIDDTMQISQQ